MTNPRKPVDAVVALAEMRRSAELMCGKIKPHAGPLVLPEGFEDATNERASETIAFIGAEAFP